MIASVGYDGNTKTEQPRKELMALSDDKIRKLYQGSRFTGVKTRTGSKSSRKRRTWMDCEGTVHTGNPPASLKGGFEGNLGTPRRSRKGRTYREPNGSRRYVTPWEGTVIAYRA
jgi:hypothetical protein